MAFLNVDTVYTVTFGALLDDHLILTVTYQSSVGSAISTQFVLHKDRRIPEFISRNPKIWKNSEYQSIIDQTNAWCDSLDFPRPNWK